MYCVTSRGRLAAACSTDSQRQQQTAETVGYRLGLVVLLACCRVSDVVPLFGGSKISPRMSPSHRKCQMTCVIVLLKGLKAYDLINEIKSCYKSVLKKVASY